MPSGGADEQIVLEHVAQAIECVAHRGLAQADASPGAGHAALLHHRVEDDEEVEVEGAPIHSPHVIAARMQFNYLQ